MHYIITRKGAPPIRPDHIAITNTFSGAFQHEPSEICANAVVEFCQKRGIGWHPISEADFLAHFFAKTAQGREGFDALVQKAWIKVTRSTIILSKEFVALCYASAPK